MPAHRRNQQGRRLTTAGLIAVSAATLLMMAWAIFPSAAFADGTVNWTGNGSENNEPCEEGEDPGFHWIFTTGGGTSAITSVNLFVNGSGPFAMSPNPAFTQWDADVVSGEVVSAHADFVGTLGKGQAVLTISHGCFEDETTTSPPSSTTETTTETETTTTETTTSETTTSETTTTESSTTETTTSGTSTSSTTSGTSSSTTPPGGTSTTQDTSTSTTSPIVGPTTVEPSETDTVSPTTITPGGTAFTGVENVVPLGAIALMLLTSGSGLLWAGARRRRGDSEDEE